MGAFWKKQNAGDEVVTENENVTENAQNGEKEETIKNVDDVKVAPKESLKSDDLLVEDDEDIMAVINQARMESMDDDIIIDDEKDLISDEDLITKNSDEIKVEDIKEEEPIVEEAAIDEVIRPDKKSKHHSNKAGRKENTQKAKETVELLDENQQLNLAESVEIEKLGQPMNDILIEAPVITVDLDNAVAYEEEEERIQKLSKYLKEETEYLQTMKEQHKIRVDSEEERKQKSDNVIENIKIHIQTENARIQQEIATFEQYESNFNKLKEREDEVRETNHNIISEEEQYIVNQEAILNKKSEELKHLKDQYAELREQQRIREEEELRAKKEEEERIRKEREDRLRREQDRLREEEERIKREQEWLKQQTEKIKEEEEQLLRNKEEEERKIKEKEEEIKLKEEAERVAKEEASKAEEVKVEVIKPQVIDAREEIHYDEEKDNSGNDEEIKEFINIINEVNSNKDEKTETENIIGLDDLIVEEDNKLETVNANADNEFKPEFNEEEPSIVDDVVPNIEVDIPKENLESSIIEKVQDEVTTKLEDSKFIKRESRSFLVVDDAKFMRTIIKKILIDDGYEVVGEAENGRDAIKLADTLKPDAITLDIAMPDIDGLVALDRILKKNPEIKVIMCSAADTEDKIQESIDIGAKGFISKPFEKDKALDIIRGIVY